MKIINKRTGETIADITTNHSMTLDEAICLVGEFVEIDNPDDPDVIIGGRRYYSEELDMAY